MARNITALRWGVKQSFRNYVQGSGGEITPESGAERDADGGFVFAAAPGGGLTVGDDGQPQGSGAFAGAVQFKAHGGMLSVRLEEIQLEVRPDGAVISVAEAPGRRLDFAKLDLAAISTDSEGDLAIPAVMAKEGWLILGDHYPPGTVIDPVRLTLAK